MTAVAAGVDVALVAAVAAVAEAAVAVRAAATVKLAYVADVIKQKSSLNSYFFYGHIVNLVSVLQTAGILCCPVNLLNFIVFYSVTQKFLYMIPRA